MSTDLYTDAFNTFWDRCWSILRAHEAHIVTAKRAIKVLESKKQRILSNQAEFIGEPKSSDIDRYRSLIKFLAPNSNASTRSLNHPSLTDQDNSSLDNVPETEFAHTIGLHEDFTIHNIDITWLDQCLADLDWLEPSTS